MTPAPTLAGCLLLLTSMGAAAAECTLYTKGIAFGTARAGARTETSRGELFVRCHGKAGETVSYTVKLSTGHGSFRRRLLHSEDVALPYNLYLDPGHTRVWGDGSAGSEVLRDTLELTGTTAERRYPVHGGEFTARASHVGSYSDSVDATLDY